MTVLTVETAAELMEAFETAPDGSIIELSEGSYGTVTLEGRIFDTGLTLRAADPDAAPVFTDRLVIDSVTGLTVTGLDLLAEAIAPEGKYRRMEVIDSAQIDLSDITIVGHVPTAAEGLDPTGPDTARLDPIAGYGYGSGLQIVGSQDVRLTDSSFSGLRTAVGVSGSQDLELSGLDISEVREGIDFFDVSDMEIAESQFHAFKPWQVDGRPSDHADMIQYWGNNAVSGVHRITIRDNLFYQNPEDSETQTIYGSMKKAPDGVTASDFTVTGNTIVNGHLNAIALYDMQGALIADNLILPKADLPDAPRQVVTPGIVLVDVNDIDVTGNTLLPFRNGRPVKADQADLDDGTIDFAADNVLLSTDPASPLFWRDFLADVAAPSGPDDTPVDDTPVDDTPVDDTPVDDAPSGVTALADAALAAGAVLVEGTDGADVLSGAGPASVLLGYGGADKLWTAQAGEDNVLEGGDGGDRFVFDLRDEGGTSRAVVADLDFAGGDEIMILTSRDGHFTDDADPGNSLPIYGGGTRADLETLADLAEAVASGALTAADGEHGLVLSLPGLEARTLEIAGLYASDLPM